MRYKHYEHLEFLHEYDILSHKYQPKTLSEKENSTFRCCSFFEVGSGIRTMKCNSPLDPAAGLYMINKFSGWNLCMEWCMI